MIRTRAEVAPTELVVAARTHLDAGRRLALVAGHDDENGLRVVYCFVAGPPDERHELVVRLGEDQAVPSLAAWSFPASRFERELADDFGIVAQGHPSPRPLVRHQHWPEGWFPMRRDAGPRPPMREDPVPYPFTEVRGDGVYEIPVGPVHAGLIEPGHFRFAVVGERILKMTARLWYVHRGMEGLFAGADLARGLWLAERISGDSAVAHSLALTLATEEARGRHATPEAQRLRDIVLELERMHNHVADIGALCNDVGYAVAYARAQVIRERLLRLNERVTGHRLLRGAITPSTTPLLCAPDVREIDEIVADLDAVVDLALSNSVVVDRFVGTAVLESEVAASLGVVGLVARASGIASDARYEHPLASQPFTPVVHIEGDVMARLRVRIDEFRVSAAMVVDATESLRSLSAEAESVAAPSVSGLGLVEGWRGVVAHRVELIGEDYARVRVVDPSFFNWPALAASLRDTIVPDFPVANKSFNLSYAGNDL